MMADMSFDTAACVNGSGAATSIDSASDHTILGRGSDWVGAARESLSTTRTEDINPNKIVTHCVQYNVRPKCVGGVICLRAIIEEPNLGRMND